MLYQIKTLIKPRCHIVDWFYTALTVGRCAFRFENARKNRQTHITNPSRKTFTTLDFSEDGHYLVTGECGHQPHVRVWDVHDKSMVVEFPGHKFGINCVVSNII